MQRDVGACHLDDCVALRGLDLNVLAGHSRVADGQSFFAAEIDIRQDNVGDGRFRQADNRAGHGSASCGDVLEHDVVEVRREARDGRGLHGAFGRQDAGIVFADHKRVFHILHINVAEDEVRDIVAAVAIGLDANAVIGAIEVNALGENVARATGDLAADGKAMAVHEGAIGDDNVAAGIIAAGGVDGAGFDGDVVVTGVGVEMVDADIR